MDEPIKVLLVKSRPEGSEELQEMIQSLGLGVVDVASEGQQWFEMTKKLRPDVVLMDDDTIVGVDYALFARKIRHDFNIAAILLTAPDDPDWIDEKVEAGLHHILVKPFNSLALYAKIRSVVADQEDRKRWERDRRVIDEAKGILMQNCGLSEPDAYGRLRRQSMHMHKTLPDVARDVIAAAEVIFWSPTSSRG